MKKIIISVSLIVISFLGNAQVTGNDSAIKSSDTLIHSFLDSGIKSSVKKAIKPKPPKRTTKTDSTILISKSLSLNRDSSFNTKKNDSSVKEVTNPPKKEVIIVDTSNYGAFVLNNTFASLSAPAVMEINKVRKDAANEPLFYIISGVLLLFGLFKVFYSKYFFNVFKVFFNTSLRQGQLTDILLQARLASLMFNILFVISSGLYLWLVLKAKGVITSTNLVYIPFAVLAVTLVYLSKYFVIKFIGWLTSYKQASNQYVFVIFLINKIIGVFLLPFIILLAFGSQNWISTILLSSFLLLGTLFLLRYFRTYGILQKQLSLNLFHFSLYLIGIEILPIIVLYRVLVLWPQLVF